MKKEAFILFLFLLGGFFSIFLIGNGISGMIVFNSQMEDLCFSDVDCNAPEISGFATAVMKSEEKLDRSYNFQLLVGLMFMAILSISSYTYITHHNVLAKIRK